MSTERDGDEIGPEKDFPGRDFWAEWDKEQRKRNEELEKGIYQRRRRQLILFTLLFSILGLFVTILLLYTNRANLLTRPPTDDEMHAEVLSGLSETTEERLGNLQRALQQMEVELDALSQIPEGNEVGVSLRKVEARITSLSNRMEALEQVIFDDPIKTLETTLMRRDMDELGESLSATQAGLREEVNRIYTQNNWFLGLMLTSMVSLVGLAISNFLRPK